MERFHVHQIFHEFCKECPYAEVITEGPKKVFADGEPYEMAGELTITCKNYGLCEKLHGYLKVCWRLEKSKTGMRFLI